MNTEQAAGQTRPDTCNPLRGGLKGRFAEDFCVLQGTVDALTRYLEQQAPEPVRSTGLEALKEMSCRIQRLERLADNAADLALGAQLRQLRPALPLELVSHLRELCACAQEELAACRHTVRMTVQSPSSAEIWLEADDALVNSLMANLISNSVRAGADTVELTCTDDQRLVYRDNGSGPEPAVQALLTNGTLTADLLNGGATGLLLVREYASALGWTLDMKAGDPGGFCLTFLLPSYCPDPSRLVLADDANTRAHARELCRYRLRREFEAVLTQE